MENGHDNDFKKLIRQAGPDQPAVNFTENVLKNVRFELQEKYKTEDIALRSLLKVQALDQPSFEFDRKLLNKIQAASPATEYKPIISKKAWYGIAAAVSFLLLISFFIPSDATDANAVKVTYLEEFVRSAVSFTQKMQSTFELVGLTLIALSSLMLIDYFMRAFPARHIPTH